MWAANLKPDLIHTYQDWKALFWLIWFWYISTCKLPWEKAPILALRIFFQKSLEVLNCLNGSHYVNREKILFGKTLYSVSITLCYTCGQFAPIDNSCYIIFLLKCRDRFEARSTNLKENFEESYRWRAMDKIRKKKRGVLLIFAPKRTNTAIR